MSGDGVTATSTTAGLHNRRRGTGPAGIPAVLSMAVAVGALLVTAGRADAHEERASQFPAGTGRVPAYRALEQAADILVVCKPDSGPRIAVLADPQLRGRNRRLLARCQFEHLQAAVDAVRSPGTNVYVLPGSYREEPSWSPPCTQSYDGRVVDYELVHSCGEVLNLITIAGDDPADPDIACDGVLCDLQIEGTGARPEDVVFTAGFGPDGDWVKHNILKADRADGIYLRNMTFELAAENAVYVHETDGYALEDIVARNNDLYGILTFTSDHGRITGCDTHHNGDSGVYPGSAADVNATTKTAGPLNRWSVEVTGCNIHHNGVGLAGTAGNSLYVHDNEIHHNGLGIGVDSTVGGHPGMPQDHAWVESNRIFANNENYFANVQGPNAPCAAPRPVDRGHQRGVVCPATPVPVGSGVLIIGGNANLLARNEIFDNWRYGVMLSWAPGALRGDFSVAAQVDTSHHNEFRDNRFGIPAAGVHKPNGLDVWWDHQGLANCWESNVSSHQQVTSNALLGLPTCLTGGSKLLLGNVVKTAQLLPCAQYNRWSQPDPVGCDWLRSPSPPSGQSGLLPFARISVLPARTIGWLWPGLAALWGIIAWRRGGRSRAVTALIVLALLVSGCSGDGGAARPSPPSARLTWATEGAAVTLADLGKGAHIMRYAHGEETQLDFVIATEPGSPVRVTGARLDAEEPSLAVPLDATVNGRALPTELDPGDHVLIALRTRSENCRYYQEREAQMISSLRIDVINGGRREVWRIPLDRGLVVRSPHIVGCPDRTLDRSDDVRHTNGKASRDG